MIICSEFLHNKLYVLKADSARNLAKSDSNDILALASVLPINSEYNLAIQYVYPAVVYISHLETWYISFVWPILTLTLSLTPSPVVSRL